MSTTTATPAGPAPSRFQQGFKWTIYSLLLINFGFYLLIDATQAIHTLHRGSTLFDMSSAFATSGAVLAWFMLLASLELETYAIDDSNWTDRLERLTHGVRIVAFLVIAHFIFALLDYAIEVEKERPFEATESLCDLVDRDLSWSSNLHYEVLSEENCATLSSADRFYQLGRDPVVTDGDGLKLARQLAWGDVLEIAAWIVVIIAMELMVRLQGRGVTDGRAIGLLRGTKYACYGVLFCLGFWWASLGHELYLWDTFLWIAGFGAIEMNLRLWRDEIRAERMAQAGLTEASCNDEV